jgi:O-acetyl-ADP-ribose deacetylase (regulator of RNase III)
MQLVNGDLVVLAASGEYDVVIHGCNCMNQMGKGVALYLKNKWSEVYAADCMTVKGDASKLGTYTVAHLDVNSKPVVVVNAYTQYHYNGAGVLLNYGALDSVLKQLKTAYSGKKLLMSKIGCGLAKGDWSVVSDMVATHLNGEDVTVVQYDTPV